MARIRRILNVKDLSKASLIVWLTELGFNADEDDDGDLRFDITPYLNGHLLVGEAMIELLIVERYEHLEESMGVKLVNQLNGRRFTPKWLWRDGGSVLCAYRYDWQGNVSFSSFARVVRMFGAMATKGYHWVEQADDAARRYKEANAEDQKVEAGEASASRQAESGDANMGTASPAKTLH